MAYRHLTDKQVADIADRFDFKSDSRIVTDNAQQADEYHGSQAPHPDWGTDSLGRYDAAKLLDGYLREESRAAVADARAARQFARDAY